MSFVPAIPRKRVRVLESNYAGDVGDMTSSIPCKILTKEQTEYRSIIKLDLGSNYFTPADVTADPFFPLASASSDDTEDNSSSSSSSSSSNSGSGKSKKPKEKHPLESAMDLVQKAYQEVSAVGEISKVLRDNEVFKALPDKQGDIKTTAHEKFPSIFRRIPASKSISLQRQSLSSISTNFIEVGIADSLSLISNRQSVIRQITDLQRYWAVDISKAYGVSVDCGYSNMNSTSSSSAAGGSGGNSLVSVQLVVEENSLLLAGEARNFRSSDSQLKFKVLNFELLRREEVINDDGEEECATAADAAGGGGASKGDSSGSSTSSSYSVLGSINSWGERDWVDQNVHNNDHFNSSAFINYLRDKYANDDSAINLADDFNNLLDIHEFCLRRQHEVFCRLIFKHLMEKYSFSDRIVVDSVHAQHDPDLNPNNSSSASLSDLNITNILEYFGVFSNSFEVKSVARSKIVLSISSRLVLVIELKDYFYNTSNRDSFKSSDSNAKSDISTFLVDKLRVCYLKSMIFTYYHIYKSPKSSSSSSTAQGLSALFMPRMSAVADVGDKKTQSVIIDNNFEHPFEEIMSRQDTLLPLSLVNIMRAAILRYLTEKSLSLALSDGLSLAADSVKFTKSKDFMTRKILNESPLIAENRETYEISRGVLTQSSGDAAACSGKDHSAVMNYQILAVFSTFEDNLFSGNHANIFASEYMYKVEFGGGDSSSNSSNTEKWSRTKTDLCIHIVQGKLFVRWTHLPPPSSTISSKTAQLDNAMRVFNSTSQQARFYDISDVYQHIKLILATFTLL